MNCEMCGKEIESAFLTDVEGSTLKVCKQCSSFGKIIQRPVPRKFTKRPFFSKPKPKKEEIVEDIVENYAELIRTSREKKGLTQKEFARKLFEKESIVQKMETGSYEPSISLARKLEKILKINLINEIKEESKTEIPRTKSEGFTLGDFIKIKKKN